MGIKDFEAEVNDVIKYRNKDPDFLEVAGIANELGEVLETYKHNFARGTPERAKYNKIYLFYDSLMDLTNEKIAKNLTKILKS